MWNFNIVMDMLKKNNQGQKELALFLGVTEQKISDWKNGRLKSWVKYAPRIAEFFDVPVETFNDEAKNNKSINDKNPATDTGDGHTEVDPEIYAIVSQLSADNRQKLLELGRMYLAFQQRTEEKE